MGTVTFLLLPFLACLLLILIHTWFGIHILERGIIFVDLALAQFIGIGIALNLLLGRQEQYALPLAFAFGGALILATARRLSGLVNIEAFIGVLYIFSLSASLLILDKAPHGLEEFKGILNGNILWVTPRDLIATAAVYGVIGLLHFLLRKKLYALSFGQTKNGFRLELLFFGSFAVVLVKSVQLAGILQVFSFLVIPALIGRLFCREPSQVLLVGWLAGTSVSLIGTVLSFTLDMPTAPVIVAALALIFFALLSFRFLLQKRRCASASFV